MRFKSALREIEKKIRLKKPDLELIDEIMNLIDQPETIRKYYSNDAWVTDPAEGVKCLICAVFFAIVTVQVFKWGMIIYRTGEVSETLKMIYYPFVWCVALGFAVLTFTLLIDFIFAVTKTERT